MLPITHKVYGYITYRGKLLVFRHIGIPEAGIQVPGGTVKPDEDFATAVLREAQEETGLDILTHPSYLGEQIRDMRDIGRNESHHRHFYHITCENKPAAVWQHDEMDPNDGTPYPIPLEFFWAALPDEVPALICDQGILLRTLVNQLKQHN